METNDPERQKDIAFFAGLTNAEISRVRAQLAAVSPERESGDRDPGIERLAEELGRLSARLVILEEAAELKLLGEVQHAIADDSDSNAQEQLIDAIYDPSFFHHIETDDQDRRFAWTRTDDFSFQPDVGSHCPKYLQIYFVAIIKSEYAKRLRLSVNEQTLPHIIYKAGNELCIEGRLRRLHPKGKITIRLQLPASHPLSTLEAGDDWRELGIAISRVVLTEQSAAPFVKRLLRY